MKDFSLAFHSRGQRSKAKKTDAGFIHKCLFICVFTMKCFAVFDVSYFLFQFSRTVFARGISFPVFLAIFPYKPLVP